MKLISHVKSGVSFGLTSSIITTLGLMVGLFSGTHSRLVVLGGIITIAIADALSDALAMHVSEESEGRHSAKEVWGSTFATFFAKFFFAIMFVVPMLLLDLSVAIIASVAFGLVLIAGFSYWIALSQKRDPLAVVFEHLAISVTVIVATYFVGQWTAAVFV